MGGAAQRCCKEKKEEDTKGRETQLLNHKKFREVLDHTEKFAPRRFIYIGTAGQIYTAPNRNSHQTSETVLVAEYELQTFQSAALFPLQARSISRSKPGRQTIDTTFSILAFRAVTFHIVTVEYTGMKKGTTQQ